MHPKTVQVVNDWPEVDTSYWYMMEEVIEDEREVLGEVRNLLETEE